MAREIIGYKTNSRGRKVAIYGKKKDTANTTGSGTGTGNNKTDISRNNNSPASTGNNPKKSRDRKFSTLRYPVARIETDSDYLEVKVLEYQPPGLNAGQGQNLRLQSSSESLKNKEIILGKILLPIPETIVDSNGVTWGEDRLTGLAAAGLNIANSVITADSVDKAIAAGGDSASTALKQLSSDKGSISALNSIFASATVNALGGSTNPTGILARQSGSILNPNMELLFGGVQLRQFSFDFDFSPRDDHESTIIRKIIRAFKKSLNAKNGSLEENASGLFIKSPDIFQLTYKTGANNHQFLHKFKPMALVNMTTNHTGSGTYATYDNTSPVHIKVNLTFTELNPIYSEDYESEEGLEGTGF